MLLSQAEIARMIAQTGQDLLKAHGVILPVPHAKAAAHAIAEAMKGKVVFECGATVERVFTESEPSEVAYTETLRFDEIPPAWLSSVPDGQRVRVYVTLVEERDGQEVG